jgi:hypothetical protein
VTNDLGGGVGRRVSVSGSGRGRGKDSDLRGVQRGVRGEGGEGGGGEGSERECVRSQVLICDVLGWRWQV